MTDRTRTDSESFTTDDAEAVVATVRERYGQLATAGGSCCCGGTPQPTSLSAATALGYDPVQLSQLPQGVDLGLGCGAPVAALELVAGERVLDLGSGAGIDVQLAARQVGPAGRAIGVDMTSEMLVAARRLAAEAGLANAEFRAGRLERLPVDDAEVDAVTSNCVINLVPDKSAVFREVFRVLRPGGRIAVSDIILDGELPAEVRSSVLAYVGCVAGAMARERYFALLRDAGFERVEVLKDVDYIALAAESLPETITTGLRSIGLQRDALAGIVRSVTFRAWKPAAG